MNSLALKQLKEKQEARLNVLEQQFRQKLIERYYGNDLDHELSELMTNKPKNGVSKCTIKN